VARKPKVTFKMTSQRRLERELTKQVEKKAGPQIQRVARERIAAVLNEMVPDYSGKPVDEVKQAVVARLTDEGVQITDPELSQYAEEIAQGGSFTA
jgi:hypothetical protein